MRRTLALFALTFAAHASAQRYEGLAYAADDSARLLYTESHWIVGDGASSYRLVLYLCPDGQPFARKHVASNGDEVAPDFEFEDERSGYREGVRTRNGQREVFFQTGRESAEHAAILRDDVHGAIDAGFDAFVRAHWDASGSVDMPFVVPSRLGYLDFRMQPLADSRISTRRFSIRLDAWYGFALPRMDAIYDSATRRLLEYRGLGNIRDANGNNLDVRIVFPPDQWQRSASLEEIRNAEGRPLDGNCQTEPKGPS